MDGDDVAVLGSTADEACEVAVPYLLPCPCCCPVSDPRSIDGRTSFFCFDAGRISSKSTGTPRETRNRRRMRDLTQFCGCSGGGATSCDQREMERSVWKMAEALSIGSTGGREVVVSLEPGKSRSRGVSRAEEMSERVSIVSKSRRGGWICYH